MRKIENTRQTPLSSPCFAGFHDYYVREMLPDLLSYEPKRRSLARDCVLIIVASIASMLIAAAAIIVIFTSLVGVFAACFVILAIACIAYNWRASSDYTNINDILAGGIAAFLQLDHCSDARRPRRLTGFRKYGLVPEYDEMECGNIVEGEIDGIRFAVSEAFLARRSGQRPGARKVFAGQLFCIETFRGFKDPIVLIKRKWRLPGLRRPFDGACRAAVSHRGVSRKFTVWAAAPEGAEQVITDYAPAIMALNDRYGKHRICIGFIKNRIYITVRNGSRRLGPGSLFKPLDDPARIEGLAKVFERIIATVSIGKV